MRAIMLAAFAAAMGTGQFAFAQIGAAGRPAPTFMPAREIETKFGAIVIPAQPVAYPNAGQTGAVVPQPTAAEPSEQAARLASSSKTTANAEAPNTGHVVGPEVAGAIQDRPAPEPGCANCRRRKSCKNTCRRILEWLIYCPSKSCACHGKSHLAICRPHGYEFFLRPCYGCAHRECSCGVGSHAYPRAR